jgi:probable selenium-dependent hydroxylase accessory protein YqeC
MYLQEALQLSKKEVISLVSGGGKTTLMFSLARELATAGYRVITTTTTKILVPEPSHTPRLILEKNEARLLDLVRSNIEKFRQVTLAREELGDGKLQGLRPELVNQIAEGELADYIIVEADGAAHHSLKAPNATEPVIPQDTTLLIPVIGIDVLDHPLTEEYVFRAEIASRLLGIPLGSNVSERVIAALVLHPAGILKNSPAQARIIPFINKMDLEKDLSRGVALGRQILSFGHPRIDRVILGQARFSEPVREIVRYRKL